ncbi:MAG: hypothetical protein ACLQGU_02515 [bacterium]
MEEALFIERNKVLTIVHNLETMREIFTEKQLLFSEKETATFFEARNRIYTILNEAREVTH